MINFGIIGYGHIGKRHAAHILQQENAHLVAICDINPSQMNHKDLAADVLTFTHIEEFLKLKKLDVVAICTPNHLHAPQAIEAMKAGFHVIVEKPLALSVEDCLAMQEVSIATGKTIFPVKQNRYNSPVEMTKHWLEEGKLGALYLIQVNCFWNRNDQYYAQSEWRGKKNEDGGCLFTQFSHFVDILYYLTGDMVAIKGIVKNYMHQHNTEFEDTGTFILQSQSGAVINFNFTTCSYQQNMEGSITLMGTEGTIKIGGQYLNTIEYQCSAHGELPAIKIAEKSNDYGFYQGSMSNHDKMIDNVVEVLKHSAPLKTSVSEATRVVGIIEEMYRSSYSIKKLT